MGTGNSNGEVMEKKHTFPSQELPCSGSTGIISALVRFFNLTLAPRGNSITKIGFLKFIHNCNLCGLNTLYL